MYFRFHIKTSRRIKYEKKHKDLFKKFHTREGLELANKEAFESLMKIDTRGEYWNGFIKRKNMLFDINHIPYYMLFYGLYVMNHIICEHKYIDLVPIKARKGKNQNMKIILDINGRNKNPNQHMTC